MKVGSKENSKGREGNEREANRQVGVEVKGIDEGSEYSKYYESVEQWQRQIETVGWQMKSQERKN